MIESEKIPFLFDRSIKNQNNIVPKSFNYFMIFSFLTILITIGGHWWWNESLNNDKKTQELAKEFVFKSSDLLLSENTKDLKILNGQDYYIESFQKAVGYDIKNKDIEVYQDKKQYKVLVGSNYNYMVDMTYYTKINYKNSVDIKETKLTFILAEKNNQFYINYIVKTNT